MSPRPVAAPTLRSRGRARGRFRPLLAAARRALVAGPRSGSSLGAVIGYSVSLGGSQAFKATATLYLGQPYSASGNVAAPERADEPEHGPRDRARARSSIQQRRARSARRSPATSRRHLDAVVAGNIAKNGQTPLVSITRAGEEAAVAACAANALAQAVIDRIVGLRESEDRELQRADLERRAARSR